jgi:hypothetical protein
MGLPSTHHPHVCLEKLHHHFVVLTYGPQTRIDVWRLNPHVQPKHTHGLANLLGVIHGTCSKPISQTQTLSETVNPDEQTQCPHSGFNALEVQQLWKGLKKLQHEAAHKEKSNQM